MTMAREMAVAMGEAPEPKRVAPHCHHSKPHRHHSMLHRCLGQMATRWGSTAAMKAEAAVVMVVVVAAAAREGLRAVVVEVVAAMVGLRVVVIALAMMAGLRVVAGTAVVGRGRGATAASPEAMAGAQARVVAAWAARLVVRVAQRVELVAKRAAGRPR